MELKEYVKIIKNNYKFFIFIILIVVFSSLLFFYTKPISYDVSLVINITRSGASAATEYNYGGFYRLQADEKFAETVVRWLKSPRIAQNILEEAELESGELNMRKLARIFKAEKMSSQVISISFSSANEEQANRISQSIKEIISRNTENLNKYQKENDWFKIIALTPVIIKNQTNFCLIFLISLVVGIIIAFWAVLLIHYFKE